MGLFSNWFPGGNSDMYNDDGSLTPEGVAKLREAAQPNSSFQDEQTRVSNNATTRQNLKVALRQGLITREEYDDIVSSNSSSSTNDEDIASIDGNDYL